MLIIINMIALYYIIILCIYIYIYYIACTYYYSCTVYSKEEHQNLVWKLSPRNGPWVRPWISSQRRRHDHSASGLSRSYTSLHICKILWTSYYSYSYYIYSSYIHHHASCLLPRWLSSHPHPSTHVLRTFSFVFVAKKVMRPMAYLARCRAMNISLWLEWFEQRYSRYSVIFPSHVIGLNMSICFHGPRSISASTQSCGPLSYLWFASEVCSELRSGELLHVLWQIVMTCLPKSKTNICEC